MERLETPPAGAGGGRRRPRRRPDIAAIVKAVAACTRAAVAAAAAAKAVKEAAAANADIDAEHQGEAGSADNTTANQALAGGPGRGRAISPLEIETSGDWTTTTPRFRNWLTHPPPMGGGQANVFIIRRNPLVQGKSPVRAVRVALDPDGGGDQQPSEMRVVKRLRRTHDRHPHPNIISMYEYLHNTAFHQVAHVMEWANAGDLNFFGVKVHRRNFVLPERFLHYLFLSIARAVEYLHKGPVKGADWRCILHCDIKPANILLSKTRDPGVPYGVIFKLCDFELGEYHDPSRSWPRLQGTQPYQPPELEPSPQSDVWALGACVHWLVFGRAPGDSFSESDRRYMKTLTDQDDQGNAWRIPRVVQDFFVESPYRDEFAAVMHKALHMDRDTRPSISVIANILEELEADYSDVSTIDLLDSEGATMLPVRNWLYIFNHTAQEKADWLSEAAAQNGATAAAAAEAAAIAAS